MGRAHPRIVWAHSKKFPPKNKKNSTFTRTYLFKAEAPPDNISRYANDYMYALSIPSFLKCIYFGNVYFIYIHT